MARVIIALGSNLGDRRSHLSQARQYLESLSTTPLIRSSIYETEPVGEVSTHMFYNAVCMFETDLEAMTLLEKIKTYEQEYGRDPSAPRWANRTIDLDIIDYDRQNIARQRLVVPHPEYEKRLFVLYPLQEVYPDWVDVRSGRHISALIEQAPKIGVFKTRVNW